MSSTQLRCCWCSKSGVQSACLVCALCKVISYCSKVCQAKTWKAKHKRVVAVPIATISSVFLAAAAGTGDGAAGAAATIISIGDAAAGTGDRRVSVAAADAQLQLTLRMQTFAIERDWEGVLSIESEVMTPTTTAYTRFTAATQRESVVYWYSIQ
jgi:hypothetical protein